MPWCESLLGWLGYSALVSCVVLILGSSAVLLCRQPARRLRIIELTLAGCLLAPLLGLVPGYPALGIAWRRSEPPRQQAGDCPDFCRDHSVVPAAQQGGKNGTVPFDATTALTVVPAAPQPDAVSYITPDQPSQPIAEPAEPPQHRWSAASWIVGLYVLGVAVSVAWWLAGMAALVRIVRTAKAAPPRCRQLLTEIAARRSDRIRLLTSRLAKQPFAYASVAIGLPANVFGTLRVPISGGTRSVPDTLPAWRRAVIVLPESLCNDEQAVRWALAHEWSHIELGDFRAWFLARLARVLFFYQPLVWWLRRQLRLCQDFVADAQASRQTPLPEDYAEFLVRRAAAGLLPPALVGLGMGFSKRNSELHRRIVMLVNNQSLESRPPRPWTVSVTCVALLLTALSASLALSPHHAAASQNEQSPNGARSTGFSRNGEEPPGYPIAGRGTTSTPDTVAQPTGAAKLDSDTEKRLRWGEPAAGLRGAIAIRNASTTPKPSEFPDLYLAVQNVSDAPIRLNDTIAAPKPRVVYLKNDGRILSSVISPDPTGTDVTLKPREVVFLLVFPRYQKRADGRTPGSIMAEDLLHDAHLALVAEMQMEHASAGAWTGKLRTGETNGEAAAGQPQPKGAEARALFDYWQANARTDGKIPGALIGRLGEKVKYFISLNMKDNENNRKLSGQFEKLLPRFDASHDWTQSDAISLIDDVSAICTVPLDTTLFDANDKMMRTGVPLPADLADAPWGRPSPDGLRVAWLLEPRAKQYPLGTSLRSRILVHNSGKQTAIFIMPSWQQSGKHTAQDAKGTPIGSTSTRWSTMARRMTFRLVPGEYCETPAAGVGVGARTESEEVVLLRVGTWIDAKPGDEVRFSPAAVEVRYSWSIFGIQMMDGRPLNVEPKDAADMWEKIIAERVQRELPLPSAAAERTQIICRVTHDLFGQSPTPEEIAAFVEDKSPTAQAALVQRLVRKGRVFMGSLPTGEIRFRVLPPEAAAAPPKDSAKPASSPRDTGKAGAAPDNANLSVSGSIGTATYSGSGNLASGSVAAAPLGETVVGTRPQGNCSISGQVISDATGKPVEGARMYLHYNVTHGSIFVHTDSDGKFEIRDIPTGPFSLCSSLTPGYQDAAYSPEGKPGRFPPFSLKEGEHRTGIVLKIKPACRISGKITDENGRPPESKTWHVRAWVKDDNGTMYHARVGRVNGADGSYTIDGLDKKPVYVMAIDVQAAINGDAWPPIYYPSAFSRNDAKQVSFDKSSSVDDVNITLRKEGGLVLEGTVRDEAGKPVPEAFIVAHRRDMLFDNNTAYTDAQGHYRVQGMGTGQFLVHVDAAHRGFVRTRTPLDIDKPNENSRLDFTLHRGVTISGRLVDTNGKDWQIGESYAYAAQIGKDEAMPNQHKLDEGDYSTGILNKYRPKSDADHSFSAFLRGEGDYNCDQAIFPTTSTFLIQGMKPGHTVIGLSPNKEKQKVVKILYGGRDILTSGIDTKPGEEIKDVEIVVGPDR